MHDPLLQHSRPAIVGMDGTRERPPAVRCLAALCCSQQVARGRAGLRQSHLAIAGMHRRVPVGMENDGGDNSPNPVAPAEGLAGRSGSALPHGGEGRGHVTGSPAGESECTPAAA